MMNTIKRNQLILFDKIKNSKNMNIEELAE